ncbi:MAG: FAD-dependent oxidoreductase [Thermotogae bacterium]|nr:FAD-dependent oxidoreductase [Thermotogota bacterium]
MKVIVVGGGIGGLWTALNFRRASVVVVAPEKSDGSTFRAQGGIAAALDPHDSPLLHYEDTLRAGGYFNDRKAAMVLTHYGPMVLNRLVQMGFRFSPKPHLEGGHSLPRIWNVGDETGKRLLLFLRDKVKDRVEWIKSRATSLLKERNRIVGVKIDNGKEITGDAVILATGGYAALWKRTTNPSENTGEGILMAALSGATLSDLEFMQFHPTVTLTDPPILLTEALRGSGGRIVNEDGEDIVNPLLPRDVVSRAIHRYLREGGRAFLDLERVNLERFPLAREVAQRFGLRVPIGPAAHYSIGGVRTDVWGRTDVVGLWAVGECADTGSHGANRLASNSLLEALVFGYRIAIDVEEDVSQWPEFSFLKILNLIYQEGNVDVKRIGEILHRWVGVERERDHLKEAIKQLEKLGGIGNLARGIAEAAFWRKDSRGAHFRKDHPSPSREFFGRLGVRFRIIR